MMICDVQVHIWAADTPERPWPARHPPHREPLGKEELLAEMDSANSWGGRFDLAGCAPLQWRVMIFGPRASSPLMSAQDARGP